jgi:hypothetical protein
MKMHGTTHIKKRYDLLRHFLLFLYCSTANMFREIVQFNRRRFIEWHSAHVLLWGDQLSKEINIPLPVEVNWLQSKYIILTLLACYISEKFVLCFAKISPNRKRLHFKTIYCNYMCLLTCVVRALCYEIFVRLLIAFYLDCV